MKNKIRQYIGIEPTTLTISPTHKCTATCDNCCFGCNPNIDYIMDYKTIVQLIDESISTYPSIKILVITGGECFVLGDILNNVIKYGYQKGLSNRVVTNGYWAKSYETAIARLKELVNVGLTEINFSTGDEHAKHVNINNIINAVLASVYLNIPNIYISVESPQGSVISSSLFKKHPVIGNLIASNRVGCIDASWIYFKKNKDIIVDDNIQNNLHCDNIFRGIYINPYSQLLSCCGLTVEYNMFLKLGDLRYNDIETLYEKQFDDFFKIWLFSEGSKMIYEKIMKYRNLTIQKFSHKCSYCMEIINDEENIKVAIELAKEELPNIIFSEIFNKTRLNVKKI